MKAYGLEGLRASAASIMPRRIDVPTLAIAE